MDGTPDAILSLIIVLCIVYSEYKNRWVRGNMVGAPFAKTRRTQERFKIEH